jgi:hypothetical protein
LTYLNLGEFHALEELFHTVKERHMAREMRSHPKRKRNKQRDGRNINT